MLQNMHRLNLNILKITNLNNQSLRKMSSEKFRSVTGPFNWINNQRVSPVDVTNDNVINDIEPRSGKVIAKVPISGAKDVDTAVQAAKTAFQTWSKVSK